MKWYFAFLHRTKKCKFLQIFLSFLTDQKTDQNPLKIEDSKDIIYFLFILKGYWVTKFLYFHDLKKKKEKHIQYQNCHRFSTFNFNYYFYSLPSCRYKFKPN
jgi:hypothetical protein